MGGGGFIGAVKTLATAGFAPFTGGASIAAIGSSRTEILGKISGALNLVIGKVLGIKQPSLDDLQPIGQYAVSTLTNQSDNNNVVSTIYGEVRGGGNLVFRDLVLKPDLYEIIVFASHECEEYVEVYAGNELMTQGTGLDTDNWRSFNDNLLAKVYTVKAAPIKGITTFTAPSTWNESDLSSLAFQNSPFLDASLPDGVSFIVVHHHFDGTDYNQRKDITARIRGKKVRLLANNTTIGTIPAYSNNPTECILDFITDDKNFNESYSKIDVESFYTSKTLNDTNSFSCNIAFSAKVSLNAGIQELKATNRSNIIYSQGFWKIKQDEKEKEISFSLTSDDIISNSFSWTQSKTREIANSILVSWINPDEQWQTKQSTIQDNALILSDGRLYTKEVQLRGVTNEAQADIIKELILNQFRYTENEKGERINVTPLVVKLTTTIKNSELEVGDMGTIDYYELPNLKKFIIMSINTKQSGELEVTLREYAETHYKNTSGNYII